MAQTEDTLAETFRRVRALYDDETRFRPGERASLRAAKHPDDLLTDGAFWRLASLAPPKLRGGLCYAVACFDAAEHTKGAPRFAASLRWTVYRDVGDDDLVGRALRFHRLLASEDRAELVHHLRRALRHAAQASAGLRVDWGELGADITRWEWGPQVRRRWAEEFYTARSEGAQAADAAERE